MPINEADLEERVFYGANICFVCDEACHKNTETLNRNYGSCSPRSHADTWAAEAGFCSSCRNEGWHTIFTQLQTQTDQLGLGSFLFCFLSVYVRLPSEPHASFQAAETWLQKNNLNCLLVTWTVRVLLHINPPPPPRTTWRWWRGLMQSQKHQHRKSNSYSNAVITGQRRTLISPSFSLRRLSPPSYAHKLSFMPHKYTHFYTAQQQML